LEEEVSRYRRFNHPPPVVLPPLDGFQRGDDELGHAAGGAPPRGTAGGILRCPRRGHGICRSPGDERALLLPERPKAGARLYADRIRHVLSAHPFAHGHPVTTSVGVASLPEDVIPSASDLLRAADEALYAAKRAGRNRVLAYGDAEIGDRARATSAGD